jgi:hypothetical protein
MSDRSDFLVDETGAVTVDWVVLTAGIVGMAMAMMAVLRTGLQDLSTEMATTMERDGIVMVALPALIDGPLGDEIVDRIMADARDETNEGLGTFYAQTLDDVATAEASAAPFLTDYSAADAAAYDSGAHGGLTREQYDSERARRTDALSAAAQTAALVADEANQRGLTWNPTGGPQGDGAFE